MYYIARDYRFSDSRISKYEKEAADIIHTSRTNLRSKINDAIDKYRDKYINGLL